MTGAEHFVSDAKDVDITGAMFLCNDGISNKLCYFRQGTVLTIDRGGLMGVSGIASVLSVDNTSYPITLESLIDM